MSPRRIWIVLPAALAAALLWAAPALALPPAPWTGQWNIGSETISLVQTGSTISGTFAFCGGGTYGGTVSPDDTIWTGTFTHAPGLPACSSTGQATFTATMALDGTSFSASGATVGFGSPFTFAGTYVSGGTEPRTTFRLSVNPKTASESVGQPLRLSVALLDQSGRAVATAPGAGVTYTVAGPNGGTGAAPFVPFGANGRAAITLNGTALGTDTVTISYRATPAAPPVNATATVTWLPNLASTIPNPRTVTAGPTSSTYPGKVSVRSLKTSRCVRIVAVSKKRRASWSRSSAAGGHPPVRPEGRPLPEPRSQGRLHPRPAPGQDLQRAHSASFALATGSARRPPPSARATPPVVRRIRLAP